MALAVTVIVIQMSSSTLETSKDTASVQSDAFSNSFARNLAGKGRKLALASWLESKGKLSTAPFNEVTLEGGTISITNYVLDSDVLDVSVRAVFNDAVHDMRSQYKWNSYGVNPIQIKAADLNFDISPST